MKFECKKCGEMFERKDMVIDMDTCVCEKCYQYAKDGICTCNTCEYFTTDSAYDDYEHCTNSNTIYRNEDIWNIPTYIECEYYKPIKLNNKHVRVFDKPKFNVGDKVKVCNPYRENYDKEFIVKGIEYKQSEYVYKICIENTTTKLEMYVNEKGIEVKMSCHDAINIIDESIEMLAIVRRRLENKTIDNDVIVDSINFIIDELNRVKKI